MTDCSPPFGPGSSHLELPPGGFVLGGLPGYDRAVRARVANGVLSVGGGECSEKGG